MGSQCYLPPNTGECAPLQPQPDNQVLSLFIPELVLIVYRDGLPVRRRSPIQVLAFRWQLKALLFPEGLVLQWLWSVVIFYLWLLIYSSIYSFIHLYYSHLFVQSFIYSFSYLVVIRLFVFFRLFLYALIHAFSFHTFIHQSTFPSFLHFLTSLLYIIMYSSIYFVH